MGNFEYKNNIRLICQCLLLGIVIVAGLFVPQLNYAALLMAAVFLCMADREDVVCILIFLVSFAPIFKVTLGGFTFFNIAGMVGILRGYYLSGLKMKKRLFFIFTLLATYVCLTSFRNGYSEIISFLCYLLLAGIVFVPRNISMHKMVTFAIWGIIITSSVALNSKFFPRLVQIMNSARIRISAGDYYNRFAGIDTNPNYYTLLISICIAALFVLFIDGRNKKIDYIYVGALSIFGILTVSQSFIATLGFTLIAACFLTGGKGNKKLPITILMFIGVAIFSLSFLGQRVIDVLAFRYENTVAADSLSEMTSGRVGLAQYYLSYLGNNLEILLFGKGIGAQNLGIGASHNYYLDILYHLGIFGGTLYLACLYNVFFIEKKNCRKLKPYQYLPFVIFLIRAFAINLIAREQLVFVLMLCSVTLFDREYQRSDV